MKSFDWGSFLKRHPLFSSLNEEEREWLLNDDVSEERDWRQGTEILTKGEVGDSIFLIGSGSVQIPLLKEDGPKITLSLLKKGEFFGEMAVFEGRRRSATVTAKCICTRASPSRAA